jgi:N6-adenosine-specific RNA methylase IME4
LNIYIYIYFCPNGSVTEDTLPSDRLPISGKFGVIMADPPWEIHQELPYGTMGDEEMRNLNIGCLQDDGVIFLWVTGGFA